MENQNKPGVIFELKEFHQLQAAINDLALICKTDVRGQIVGVNGKYERVTGYMAEEVMNKTHRVFGSGFHNREFYQNLWETILSGKTWSGEICNKRKNGELFWLDTSIVPEMDEDKKAVGFISISFEITNRKKTEQDRLAANEKIFSLGLVAANIAHEINNPLTVINQLSALRLQRMDTQGYSLETAKSDLEKIYRNSERITKIIKGLKSYSRNDSSDPLVLANIESIVNDMWQFCEDRLQNKNVSFQKEFHSEALVLCHPTQISQVVLNLINNSIDAIEKNDEKWIRLSAEANDESQKVRIEITVSGSGIPEEVVKNLMRPFYSTKPNGLGTGLGLSVSKKIIESHGGSLFYNCENKNTQFVIELPYADAICNSVAS